MQSCRALLTLSSRLGVGRGTAEERQPRAEFVDAMMQLSSVPRELPLTLFQCRVREDRQPVVQLAAPLRDVSLLLLQREQFLEERLQVWRVSRAGVHSARYAHHTERGRLAAAAPPQSPRCRAVTPVVLVLVCVVE